MKTILKIIRWDLLLQFRYNIITISFIIAALYVLILKSLPDFESVPLVIMLVLTDPVMFGVLFIGVLVLYEKDNNTLNALIVTPLAAGQYIWSKAISLTLIALPIAMAIAIFGYSFNIHYGYFIFSVILTSLLFVFLGFTVVTKSKGFNQYIIKFALFTIPVAIPILGLFNIAHSYLFYLIPTHATIVLLKASFNYNIAPWQIIYSLTYLLAWNYLAYRLAIRSYKLNLQNGKAHE